ncbi:MAG TPA: flagellar motor switch protein FliN [Vicinamibacterales bacterium]
MNQPWHALIEALSAEFAAVASNLLGTSAQIGALSTPVVPGWTVPFQVTAPAPFTLHLIFSKGDAGRLAARLLQTELVSESEVADALTELASQSLGAVVTKGSIAGLAATIDPPRVITNAPGVAAGGFDCRIDGGLSIRIGCAVEGEAAEQKAAVPAPPVAVPVVAPDPHQARVGPDNLEMILDIDMPLSVRFGEAVLPLESLAKLGPGALIELSRQPDDPVDVLINGRLVARGEVVVVGGNYGVRITEVVSAAERIRSINAH